MPSWATVEGAPFPQGVTWIEDEQAYNFALYIQARRQRHPAVVPGRGCGSSSGHLPPRLPEAQILADLALPPA